MSRGRRPLPSYEGPDRLWLQETLSAPKEGLKLPRITVVTPSFNQARFLEETLRSVLLQRYPDLEYLVLDGGSTDQSVAIIERYAEHLAHWTSERDGGQSAAIAKGFSMATGEVLCWLNSDDALLPGALLRVGSEFAKQPDLGVVYGNRLVVDENGRQLGATYPPFYLTQSSWAQGQSVAQESTFWKTEVYRRVGGLDVSKFFAMDYDLFARLWAAATARKVRARLGVIRVHGDAKSSKYEEIMWREFRESKRALGIPDLPAWQARLVSRINRE